MVISPLDSRSPEARKFLDDMSVWIYLLPRYCRCSSKTAEKLLREIGPLVAKDRRAQAEQINSRWSVPLAQGRSRIGVEKEIEQLFVEHLPMPVTLKLVRHPGGELRFKIDNDSAQFSTAFAVSPSDQRAVNELGPDYLDAHAYGRFGAHWAESKAAELVGFEVWTNKSTIHSVVFCPDGSILDDKFTEPAAAWLAATNAYLGAEPYLDQIDRVDMRMALATQRVFSQSGSDDSFFVALSVSMPQGANFYRTMGWEVDSRGNKLLELRPVTILKSNLQLLTSDQVELLDAINEPQRPGKGELQCEVLNDDGEVIRRVHLKARFNPDTMVVTVVGLPMLMPPARRIDPDIDFNPFAAPDPLTSQRYSVFTYVDDCGLLFTADQTRVTDGGRKVVVYREPSPDDVQSLAAVAERMVNQG